MLFEEYISSEQLKSLIDLSRYTTDNTILLPQPQQD